MIALRAFAFAAFFAGGILLADRLEPTAIPALGPGVAGVALLAAAALLQRRHPMPLPGEHHRRLSATAILLLAGAGAIGFSTLGLRAASLERAFLGSLESEVVQLEGKVASDPRTSGRGWSFVLNARRAGERRLSERIYVRLYDKAPIAAMGDRVVLDAKVSRLDRNEDFDLYLHRRRMVAKASVSADSIEVVAGTGNPVLRAANHVRRRMRALASGWRAPETGLVLGLTIGDESRIPESLREDMRASGLSHLTAVSGANVAIVLGALVLVLRALRLSRRAQIVAGVSTIAFFVIVARPEPSVLRAGTMAVLALAAFLFGRRFDSLHGLALAFVGLLAYDPFMLWSVGFQLSFAATAGILVLSPRIKERLGRLPRPAAEAAAVSVGAQTAVAPLLAFHFGSIPLAAVPANLLAFPLVAPITVLGFGAGLLAVASPAAARPVFALAGLPAFALGKVASAFADMPGGSLDLPSLGLLRASTLLIVVAGAGVWLLAPSNRRIGAPFAAAVAVAALAWMVPAASAPLPRDLRMTFFDVGQGEAALIESPGGARVLVDGGPDERFVANVLRRRGIGRIDLAVFSHAHSDHVVGLGEVLRRFDVREVVHPGVPSRLIESIAEENLRPAGEGEQFVIGDLRVDVLWPSADFREMASYTEAEGEGSALNDASVVLRIVWGTECALFTGDIEEASQSALFDAHASKIACTIMKAPHHGSPRLVEDFVHAVDPEWVVVSVGKNSFGHPSPKALSIFEAAGAQVLRTDLRSDVVLEMGRSGGVRVVP